VTIMPVKFLGPGGVESLRAPRRLSTRRQRAKVINCSWGGSYSQVIDAALQYAADHDVVVCAAAGNASMDVDEGRDSFFPASSEVTSVITVASTDDNDQLSYFSNYGDETVELAAPGEEVTSTLPYDVVGVYVNDLPFKVAYLAFAAEGIEPVSAGKAAVTGSLTRLGAAATTPIVIVDEACLRSGRVVGERLVLHRRARGAGYNVRRHGRPRARAAPILRSRARSSCGSPAASSWLVESGDAGYQGTAVLRFVPR